MTISISFAPSSIAVLVSATFDCVLVAPNGNPTTTHVLTSVPANFSVTNDAQCALTQTDAVLY